MPPAKAIPGELLALARAQAGVFTRSQARLHGVKRNHLRTMLRRGTISPLLRAFTIAGALPGWAASKSPQFRRALQEAHALRALLGPDAVVTGAVAAELLAEDRHQADPRWRERLAAGDLMVYLPKRQSVRIPGVRCIRAPLRGQAVRRGGLLLAPRTAALLDEVDLHFHRDRRRTGAMALLDFLLQRRWIDPGSPDRRLEVAARRLEDGTRPRRLAALRWAAATARAGMESPAERRCGALLRAHGLRAGGTHGWKANHQLKGERADGTWWHYRLDFAWPAQRVALEVDGWEFHSDRRSFERDRARQRDLAEARWTLLPVTWETIHSNGPQLAAQVRHALSRGPPR